MEGGFVLPLIQKFAAEKQTLHEQLAQRDELIATLVVRVQVLEERLVKDSHNSHLPPSSDRFNRQPKPKSLRTKSGKKTGGQQGHRGQSLPLSATPDEVIVQTVEQCQHCGEDLHEQGASQVERRQVIDVPEPRLRLWEYQAEQKICPHCHQFATASFPVEVHATVQYGSRLGAIAVYLVEQQRLKQS